MTLSVSCYQICHEKFICNKESNKVKKNGDVENGVGITNCERLW